MKSKFGEVLTQERLKHFLEYDENTGEFKWKFNRRGLFAGDIAGSVSKDSGYICIRVDKRLYRAHRLAWLYVYGKWPDDCIDHINHNRQDNRICNLREATKQDNQQNLSMNSANKSGVTGVSFYKAYGKWAAEISVKNEKIFLGYFSKLSDAAKARKNAELLYGFAEGHGK